MLNTESRDEPAPQRWWFRLVLVFAILGLSPLPWLQTTSLATGASPRSHAGVQLLFGRGDLLPHRIVLGIGLLGVVCSVFARLRTHRLPWRVLCDLLAGWLGVQSAALLLYLMVMTDLLGHIVIRAGGLLALGACALIALDGVFGATHVLWLRAWAWRQQEKLPPETKGGLAGGEE